MNPAAPVTSTRIPTDAHLSALSRQRWVRGAFLDRIHGPGEDFAVRQAQLLLLLATAIAPATAVAADNDFRLNATRNGNGILFTRMPDGSYAPNNQLFRDLTTELGFVFAPRLASPAETLGHSGFQVSALWSGTFVSNDQDFWHVTERAQGGRAPRGFL